MAEKELLVGVLTIFKQGLEKLLKSFSSRRLRR